MEMNEILNGLNSCDFSDSTTSGISPTTCTSSGSSCSGFGNGFGNGFGGGFGCGFGSWIWILLILFYSGGFGRGNKMMCYSKKASKHESCCEACCGDGYGGGYGGYGAGNCSSYLFLLVILFLCNGCSGFNNFGSCGSGNFSGCC